MRNSPAKSPRYWIGVASREHVLAGVDGGFCQLCHGKRNALARLAPGDWIVYYSPRTQIRGGDPVQAFTAVGRIRDGAPYPFEMAPGFIPHRRDVDFLDASDAPIRPLVERLGFIADKTRWGARFRFGLVEIPRGDFETIAEAMGVAAELQAA